ncbi:hypothetical protein [Saccharibacter floricola]|uniref:Uncharacterized protein n=1 Tax=Saccharibacter floricola DSM 15669 TaxID=1123227 RepID=A0ABQ0P0D0_9PROT|nr:hypothetical protein [Saccharibacter floricola]GBQ08070.1 hypothetical protein AA15669_1647 [Saccharibacter floricola DSM 15669]
MIPYLIAGVCVLITAALTTWLIFAYRAGRNSARVCSERQDASDATQSAEAAQRMLEARTNGIRSGNELTDELDKGTF